MTTQYDESPPDDIPTIKAHLKVRREAMAAISAEIQILLYALSQKLGTVEYLRYLTEAAREDPELQKAYEEELEKARKEAGDAPNTDPGDA